MTDELETKLEESGGVFFPEAMRKTTKNSVKIMHPNDIRSWYLRDVTQKACTSDQCFSTAGPRPDTGPWHQLYRAARGSPGICHFSFLSNFQQ